MKALEDYFSQYLIFRKPLAIIEMEERAMEELANFYKQQFPMDTVKVQRKPIRWLMVIYKQSIRRR